MMSLKIVGGVVWLLSLLTSYSKEIDTSELLKWQSASVETIYIEDRFTISLVDPALLLMKIADDKVAISHVTEQRPLPVLLGMKSPQQADGFIQSLLAFYQANKRSDPKLPYYQMTLSILSRDKSFDERFQMEFSIDDFEEYNKIIKLISEAK